MELVYHYKAEVVDIVDGDTVDVIIDLGFNTFKKQRLRLKDIDAPENRTRNKLEKKAGLLVEEYLKDLILNREMIIMTEKLEKGSFNRYLADLYFKDSYKSLTKMLKEKGLVKKYGHKGWKGKELKKVIEKLS